MSDVASHALAETRRWLEAIVIGLNLCPFAKAELDAERIRFQVSDASALDSCLEELLRECLRLDDDDSIATTLIVYPEAFADWHDYLDLVDLAGALLVAEGYEGTYQLASFHPQYQFADTEPDDPGNLTNRSPCPILHILREDDVEKRLADVAHPENIPIRNEALCRRLGAEGIARLLRV